MQAPQMRQPVSNGKVGYLIALVSVLVSLFSFFALPYADSDCFFGLCSSNFFWDQLAHYNMFSWTLLVVMIIIFIIALFGILRTNARLLAISLIVFGFLGMGLFSWGVIGVKSIGASPDPGIWVCLFGMFVAAICGIFAIRASPRFRPQRRRRLR